MADKIQRQVQSISKAGSARLKGDVTLTGGSNVTLTQSGNDISIASTGGSGGGTVDTVVAGNNIDVDATDPANPVVAVETLTLADVSDVTATSTEVNVLDGITADTTELNYTDGVTSAIQTQIDGKQPLDSDLTTIAGLTATTDNFMVATASAWASRTPSQARTQLGLGTLATQSGTFSGTSSGTNTGDQTITLTGDVTGTGTGTFATTIGSGKVTEAMQVLADNTTNDFSTTKHGYVPKGTNVGSFLKDDGTWAAVPGGGDALTANPLSQFAATTSSQLKGVLSDETGSGAAVFATSPALVTPTGIVKGDVGLGNVDNTSDATKQAATLLAAHPVGTIYINTSNTNPGTFIGGTWVAFGAGRVLVGFDSGDTDFDADEETGGAKTVATNVTVATQPTFTVDSHTHPLSSAGQALIRFSSTLLTMRKVSTASFANTAKSTIGSTSAHTGSDTDGAELAGATDATSGTATTRTADVALTNNATSVQQKYIVVRMWKRTA